MRDKVLVPAVLLICASLMIAASMIAVNADAQEAGSDGAAEEALPAADDEVMEEGNVTAEEMPVEAGTDEVTIDDAEAEEEESILIPVGTADDEEGAEGEAVEEDAENRKISVHLEDVPLEDVVKLFARMTDANIITGTNLIGTVSVHLQDVEWKPALNAILAQQNLALKDNGVGVFSIVKRPANVPDPLFVETIFLKYAKVSEIVGAIRSSLEPRGQISNFISRNAMVIRSTRKNLEEIRAIIDQIDIPRGQVYIEAKFMELTDTAIKNLGINWQMLQGYQLSGSATLLDQMTAVTEQSSRADDYTRGDARVRDNSLNESMYLNPDGTITPQSTEPTLVTADSLIRNSAMDTALSEGTTKVFDDIRTAVLSPLTFNVILSALKQESGVAVVSNPRILVANSKEAVIHVGETVTPLIPHTATVDGALSTTYTPGSAIESGVKLTVTPTINTESNITVEIAPEISRILPQGAWTTAPDGSSYPSTSTKSISTIFTLFSGETAAIGGLTETVDDDSGNKIPILGDIPLIGKYLFSWSRREKTQKETIIFVTVGLASPDRMEEDIGMPQNTELTQKRRIRDAARRRALEQELTQMRNASRQQEERSERKRRFLLKRTR